MANEEIRTAMRVSNVPMWKIADAMEVCEMTVSRMLRKELPAEKKELILKIVHEKAGEPR